MSYAVPLTWFECAEVIETIEYPFLSFSSVFSSLFTLPFTLQISLAFTWLQGVRVYNRLCQRRQPNSREEALLFRDLPLVAAWPRLPARFGTSFGAAEGCSSKPNHRREKKKTSWKPRGNASLAVSSNSTEAAGRNIYLSQLQGATPHTLEDGKGVGRCRLVLS